MRPLLLAGLLIAGLPLTGAPPSQKAQCRDHCSFEYNLCMKRAVSKAAKKSCSVSRKTCKYGCGGR